MSQEVKTNLYVDVSVHIKGLKWKVLGIRVLAFWARVFGIKVVFDVDGVEEDE